MSNQSELVARYFAAGNQEDASKRLDLIESTLNAVYLAMLKGQGQEGIAMIQGVHQRFPGLLFRLSSAIEEHHGCLRFSWELAPKGGAIAKGTDFAVLQEGRRESVTGFFDLLPGGGQ